jgi:glycosyltransferase involved in cell wall biosynthesis
MKVRKQDLHVAMFIPGLGGGGAERVFVQLANGLSSKVGKVDFIVARSDGHYRQFVSGTVNVIDLQRSRTLATLFALRRYIKVNKPDVVLSTMTDANVVILLATLFSQPPPVVVIRETIMMSENLRHFPWLKAKVLGVFAGLLYPNADAIVSLSKGVAIDLEKRMGDLKRPVRVIYNPGPSEQEYGIGGQPSEQFLKSKEDGFVFVALGRLHEQKDYPTLIKAFAKIRKEVRSNLWILGEGEEQPALETLVRELGLEKEVFMPGFVRDPYPYLRAADVFVMSSKYEGGPSSMLQAMACGCKVVSTDAPCGPAEFLEYGQQGYLVPVGDVDAFADSALRSLKEPLDLELRKKSMKRFDPQAIVDEYLEFLYNVSASRQS